MDTNIDASTDIGASTDIDADRRQLPLDENSRRPRQMPPHIMAQLEERIQRHRRLPRHIAAETTIGYLD